MIITYNSVGVITGLHGAYPPGHGEYLSSIGEMWISVDMDPEEAYAASDRLYVDTETVSLKERPIIEAPANTSLSANGEDFIRLAGLPDPCVLSVDGVEHEITGGELDFQTDAPGSYSLRIDHWPFMPWRVEILAS